MFKIVKLTPQEDKMWSDTRSALLWHAPAFSHIFYTLMQNTGTRDQAVFTEDEGFPIAATDGANLIIKPSTFFKMSLMERVFVCAHEILHCILNHMILGKQFHARGKVPYADGTTLEYKHSQMNKAMDYVINAILIDSKLGSMPKDATGQQMGLYDTNIGTAQDDFLSVYKKIFKADPPGSNFDAHLAPGTSQGKDPQSAINDRNPSQWDTEIKAGIAAAKAMGKLPAGLERVLSDLLDPKVDWKEKIQALFARKVGSGAFDWRRPDRRMITRDIYAPGRSGFGAGTVVIGVDTSGSIGQKELDMFMAEMAGILEDVRPKELVIMWCDAEVGRVDYAEEADDLNHIRAKGAPGGGGTSFVPVFEEISKLGITPEALVYLTDGMGAFPSHAPSYPVIWGNIYEGAKYPWGDVVDIPKQA